jgi:phosphopentomutase
MRAFVLVLDSFGIGGAPDAAHYDDAGADTLGHIAEACAHGRANNGKRAGPLSLPNLAQFGLGHAYTLSMGQRLAGFSYGADPVASFGCAAEISKGKDTPSGHWELAGFPVLFDWGYFPRETPCFPTALIEELCDRAGVPGVLGNCHASGTAIIEALGEEHMRSGMPICYTSADSVFQIAAHEESFGLERLYDVCLVAKTLTDPLRIGRVIARPFVGDSSRNFERTGNRRDFATPPPAATVLDLATAEGRNVISVGKIGDIFGHSGTGEVLKASGNDALFDRTLEGADNLQDGGLLFANFIDFDSIYGHRRDTAGYAFALEQFDRRLPKLFERLDDDDLVVITADHGCDPTWRGTDHTREQVPVLAIRKAHTGCIGKRDSFADVGKTVVSHLDLPSSIAGRAF